MKQSEINQSIRALVAQIAKQCSGLINLAT